MNSPLGIVFPGQGSQSVGMLNNIAQQYPEIRSVFSESSDVLGYDLWKLIQDGPAEILDQTVHTQPALLASSVALWQVMMSRKENKPTLLAGHSLGEYSALVCANAFTLAEGIRLVAARGQFMQEAVPTGSGGMAAIVGLDNEKVADICRQSVLENEILTPANFNSPGQVVIAGHRQAVERAVILAKNADAKLAKILPVSVPSHCLLMQSAADKLKELLSTLTVRPPIYPVLSNADVTIYDTPAAIQDGLVRQLTLPVRWVDIIQVFVQKGIHHIIECGPGKVLTGLNKRMTTLQSTTVADSFN